MKKLFSIFIFILVILICITGFIWMNMGSIWDSYHSYVGDKNYKQGNYELAIQSHDKMIPSDRKYFSLGNDYYRQGNYKDAAQQFSKITTYKGLYNAGNAFYRFGEASDSISEKIDFWTRSLSFYSKSLQKSSTTQAQKNYDVVKSQLDELLEEREQEKQDEQTEESEQNNSDDESGGGSDESQQEEGVEESEQEVSGAESQYESESTEKSPGEQKDEIMPQPRGEEYSIGEDSSVPDITQEERDSLERYTDQLKDIEKQNQQFFNKSSNESFSDSTFDSFFHQFKNFDHDFGTQQEKDW